MAKSNWGFVKPLNIIIEQVPTPVKSILAVKPKRKMSYYKSQMDKMKVAAENSSSVQRLPELVKKSNNEPLNARSPSTIERYTRSLSPDDAQGILKVRRMDKELLMEEQEENMRKYRIKKNMFELYSQQQKGNKKPIPRTQPRIVKRRLNNDITPSEVSEKSYFGNVVNNRGSDASQKQYKPLIKPGVKLKQTLVNRKSNASIRLPNCNEYYTGESRERKPLALFRREPLSRHEIAGMEPQQDQHDKTITLDDQSDQGLSPDERTRDKATGVSHEVSSTTHIEQ